MSCGEGLGIKPGRFSELSLFGKGKMRCVFGGYVCENMKSGGFCTYACRGVLHTPRNVPRQRFGYKIGQVLGGHVCGNMKPAKFFIYPCRGVLHTPRNVLRRRFRSKTEQVLGASLLGKGKIGCVFGGYACGNMKPGRFWAYPYWEG